MSDKDLVGKSAFHKTKFNKFYLFIYLFGDRFSLDVDQQAITRDSPISQVLKLRGCAIMPGLI